MPQAFDGGVEAARGDFVVVLDADDVFEPERIEALSELAAARPDLEIVTTDAAWESQGRVVGRFNGQRIFEVENQRAAILERCFIVAPGVRRSASMGPRAGHGAPGPRQLGLLDPDDPRRIEGRIRRRPLLRLPPARRKRQLGTAHIVQHRVDMLEHLRTNRAFRDDDLAVLDRRSRDTSGRSRSPSARRCPPSATATRASWRSPSSVTSRTGARQG